eukprot:scaffold4326_cov59-Attheya_sp.AAC.2
MTTSDSAGTPTDVATCNSVSAPPRIYNCSNSTAVLLLRPDPVFPTGKRQVPSTFSVATTPGTNDVART